MIEAVIQPNTSAPGVTDKSTFTGKESHTAGNCNPGIVTLAAGDVIDMALSALLAVGVTLGTGVNATLTVKKLN